MTTPDRTRYPQTRPLAMDDRFTREQIVCYLDAIPLGYRTEEEHRVLEAFVHRAQRHFIELDTAWQPLTD